MVKRKGIGYMIEVVTALLIMFVFILGNTPTPPSTEWSSFQKEVIAQDLTYVMEQTGDSEDFIRNGETGSLVTAAETLSRERVEVSGTVENVPITGQTVGFHILEAERYNITLDNPPGLADDRCYQDNDLEEIEPQDGQIMRSENPRNGAYLYVADTDPEISGGDGDIDYDSVWVDNGTRCQFSSAEGPYYIEDFFYWGDGNGYNYDINSIYSDDNNLELYNATQVVDLRDTVTSRMNGIDSEVEVDTVAVELENIESYNTLVFREDDSIPVMDSEKQRLQDFLRENSILLMMDLERSDFYSGGTLEDNFLTSTGLKWVGLSWDSNPGSPPRASFNSDSNSEKLQTYFQGLSGNPNSVNLEPSGKISSSNSPNFKDSKPLISTVSGSYDNTDWNATNYDMEQVAPGSINGEPQSACVTTGESEALTRGTFDFPDYQSGSDVPYDVISVKMAENSGGCSENIRAASIDLNDNGRYDDEGEGPFLNGESLSIENKSYVIVFPDSEALQTGDAAEFVYAGDSNIETISYRTSFQDFSGRRLARMEYKQDYSEEEEKIVAATLNWLSDKTMQFGEQEESTMSTEIVAGVKENTFIPYRISMRWR